MILLDFRVRAIDAAGMKILLMMMVLQSLNLAVFAGLDRGGLGADARVTAAARGVQAQVEETLAEKQGPSILVVALKDLERLEIRVDPRKTEDCDSMAHK